MIDIYSPTNTNFAMNGDMYLEPVDCMVSATINGSWMLEMTHPLDDDGRWKYIEDGAVIKVRSFNGEQLFRVKSVTKQDSGVSVNAEPIFLDAMGDCFLMDVRPTNVNGSQALARILSPNRKYSGRSNITKTATAYYYLKNAIEAIAGSGDNAFLSRWGGEIEYNNFEIIVNDRIGADNGIEILYGKNIPLDGLVETINIANVVTRIIPKAFNGRLIEGTPYIDSPIIGAYPTIQTKVIEYPDIKLAEDVEGDIQAGDIICETQRELEYALKEVAQEEYINGIDKPLISIDCDMVLLQNTDEYKDFKDIETVSLGDTVYCNHSRLGIKSTARIISLEWNCLLESVSKVTIGDVVPNYLDRVMSTVHATEKALTPEGNVVASQITGFLDGTQTQLRVQNTEAKRQDAIAILFEDTKENSPTFGALALGTQGLQVSKLRQGGEWQWGTAITSQGIIANYIVAGILSDQNNINYWNLDTGEFRLSANVKVGGKTVQQIATEAIDETSQSEIFKLLTNNGESEGIYLKDGQLYINGTYIQAGSISADLIQEGTLRNSRIVNSRIEDSSIETYQPIKVYRLPEPEEENPPDTKVVVGQDNIKVQQDENNYTLITKNNVEIFVNGSSVWKARNI